MPHHQRTSSAAGGRTELGEIAFPGRECSCDTSNSPLHVHDIIAALQREYIAEALRIASIKAWHAADDLSLGDDASAERGIRIAIQNLREAATGFRQLEALTAAIEALDQKWAGQ